jgi:hypothetical protein
MSNYSEYISHFDGLLTFQVFPDNDQSDVRPHVINAQSATDVQSRLMKLNKQGGGIYLTVNECDGTSRKASAVTRVRSLFADLDCKKPDSVDDSDWNPLAVAIELSTPLDPHLIVESSSGKYHLYWRVKGFPLDKFKAVQKGIIDKFNHRPEKLEGLYKSVWLDSLAKTHDGKLADDVIHDLPRVLRVPGFYHRKGEPAPVTLWDGYSSHHEPYTYEEITAVFKPFEPPVRDITPAKKQLAEQKVFGDFDFKNFDLVQFAAQHGLNPRHYDGERYHVDCPWHHEHSSRTGNTDTVVFNSPNWPQFSCSHNSCRDRTTKQLVAMLNRDIAA